MKTFPEILINVKPAIENYRDGIDLSLQTNIRKKINDKWYRAIIRNNYWITYDPSVAFSNRTWESDVIQHFYKECYNNMLSSDINDFELDPDQRSEYERLNNIVKFNKLLFV